MNNALDFGDFNDDHCFHLAKKTKRAVRKKALELTEFYSGTGLYSARHDSDKPPPDETEGLIEKALESQKQPPDETEGLIEKALRSHKQPPVETEGLEERKKQPASGSQEPSFSYSQGPSSTCHRPFGPSSQPLGDALRFCGHGKKESQYKVMELFSPPRITLEAQGRGFQTTSIPAFDLECGWDFFDARDRARFWEVLNSEEPDFVSISPRCTAFSVLMNANWKRMSEEKKLRLRTECLAMMQFSIQVAAHQIQLGKTFQLEQPGSASSWSLFAMEWLLQQPGVIRFTFDQCMAGLSVVPDGSLSQKTTGSVTNHVGVALELSSFQCDGSHSHVQLESGLPLKAQQYPAAMVRSIVDGLVWGLNAAHSFPAEVLAEEDEDEEPEDGEDLEEALDRSVEAAGGGPAFKDHSKALTEEQKQKIMRVHINMGHINKAQMMALFKAAGAKPEVLRFIKDVFQCDQCMKQKRPIEARKAAFPRTFTFNRFLGIDCFFINFQGKTLGFLNIICLGTNLQVVMWLKDYTAGPPSAAEVWKAFQAGWLRPFGSPEIVQCDGGSEFKGEYERKLEQLGCLQVITDGASPWQNAKAERHGGWVKDRAEEELQSGSSVVSSPEDLSELITEVVTAKNQHFSVGGYSPFQMVFGVNPRLPLDLLSEDSLQEVAWHDINEPTDGDTPAASFSKAHAIRSKAKELCFKHHAREKVRLSGNHRKHTQRNWAVGQWVYVWRRAASSSSNHLTRSRWTGPGVVILQSGHTVWVSMRARLWKCNSDQLRAATHFESIGADMARTGELREVVAQTQHSRTGAVDVAREGPPPDEAWDGPSPQALQEPAAVIQESPLPTIQEETEELEQAPALGGQPVMRNFLPTVVETTAPQPPFNQSRRSSVRTTDEPCGEPLPAPSTPSSRLGTGEHQPKVPKVTPNLSESSATPRPVGASSSAPATPRGVSAPTTPGGPRVRRQVSEIERLERIAAQEIRRLDRAERSGRSSATQQPHDAHFESNLSEIDEITAGASFFALNYVKESHSFVVGGNKAKNAEFNMKLANEEEKAGFSLADAGEWQALMDLKAIEVLDAQKASVVRERYPSRIITSRMIRRKKPMPGVGAFKYKSRWCVHGHQDPDSHLLKTFSPTPSVESINLFFQVCLNENLDLSFGDIKNAFGQSDKLDRAGGDIWVEPCEGLSLPEGSLIKLVVPVYGLDDAPLRWHMTLLNFFFSIGFERSLLEPCWLVKRSHGRIIAQVLLEVDDINVGCIPSYSKELKKAMTDRFQFGKWEYEEADFAGRHVKRVDNKVLMNQEKYILEKLEAIKIPRGQKSDKTRLLNNEEFETFRSMLYKVHWVAHQTRPEASGIVSILSSRLKAASIHDLVCLNKLITHLRNTAQQNLVLHRFESSKMTFITAPDAGGIDSSPPVEGNEEMVSDAVQGAWVIFASDRIPSHSGKVKVSTLSWRSSKLKRRVSSTLAGEALSFSQALSEVEYLQIMFRDVVFGDVDRADWQKSLLPFLSVLRQECSLNGRQEQCQVTDAKSLYDAVIKQSPCSRQDRRTAVELAIIVESMRKSSCTLRWTPHPRMPADVLTKDDLGKSNGALEEILRTSRFGLWSEEEELKQRKEDPTAKYRSKTASLKLRSRSDALNLFESLRQVNKNLGCCFNSSTCV